MRIMMLNRAVSNRVITSFRFNKSVTLLWNTLYIEEVSYIEKQKKKICTKEMVSEIGTGAS